MSGPAYVAVWIDRLVAATASWTEEELGAYMRLLLYQAQHGSIPAEPARRARLLRMSAERAAEIWTELLADKFSASPDGQGLVNPKMAEERERALEHGRKQSERARRRWAGRDAAAEPREMPRHSRGSATAEPREVPGHSRGNATQTQTQKEDPPLPPLGGRGAGEDDRAKLLESFGDLHLERTGKVYQASRPEERAARALLGLAGAGGAQEVLCRARRLFASADPWERSNASLRTLEARWSKFAVPEPGKADPNPWGPLTRETWLAQAVDKHRRALESGDDLAIRRARLEVVDRAQLTNLPEPELPERILTQAERARLSQFLPSIAAALDREDRRGLASTP